VTHLSGREAFDAAREVIDSLGRRRGFTEAPPPGFWRREVAAFTSPRTHAEAAAAPVAAEVPAIGEGDGGVAGAGDGMAAVAGDEQAKVTADIFPERTRR
jgi:hypothetical protein